MEETGLVEEMPTGAIALKRGELKLSKITEP